VTIEANPTAAPHLHRGALGLPEVVFQGITHIAPSLNIVFTFPIIALKAGPDMLISFLLTTIVCFFIGNTVSQFSKYMPSSGGYYSFATRGLGTRSGFMTTWSYLVYDIVGPAGAIGFLGYLASTILQQASGVDVPWWIFALATFAIVWALTHFGVRLSMRTTALFGAIELLIMLALAITFLVHPGPGSSYTAPL
jgi:amino acid transporter